jgi:hypothetical protein
MCPKGFALKALDGLVAGGVAARSSRRRAHRSPAATRRAHGGEDDIGIAVEVTRRRDAGRRLDPPRLGPRRRRCAARRRARRPGANSNALADELRVDPLSGTAVFSGVPARIAPDRRRS